MDSSKHFEPQVTAGALRRAEESRYIPIPPPRSSKLRNGVRRDDGEI